MSTKQMHIVINSSYATCIMTSVMLHMYEVYGLLLFSGPLDAMLRGLALSQHGHYGNKETITEAQRRFANHVTKKELLPTNIREAVFAICMANGDHSTFDQLVQVWMHILNTALIMFDCALLSFSCTMTQILVMKR